MLEFSGKISWRAEPTPTYEKFETVNLQAILRDGRGTGCANIYSDVTVEEARALAAQINRACDIVEGDA